MSSMQVLVKEDMQPLLEEAAKVVQCFPGTNVFVRLQLDQLFYLWSRLKEIQAWQENPANFGKTPPFPNYIERTYRLQFMQITNSLLTQAKSVHNLKGLEHPVVTAIMAIVFEEVKDKGLYEKIVGRIEAEALSSAKV